MYSCNRTFYSKILLAKLYSVSMDELLSTEEPVESQAKQTVSAQAEADEDARPGNVWLAFPYPVLVTAIYLFIGFVFDLWHPGWILYLTVPLYYSIAAYYGNSKKRQ